MPFPKTRQALEDNGYSFSHTKVCPSCNVTIEMWNTPNNRQMPMDFRIDNETQSEICEPHFASCKDPAQYSSRLRNKKKKDEEAAPGPMVPDA